MNRKYTVYKHISPSDKVYIGITGRDVERRWQKGKNYKTSAHFDNAIKKYGWENIRHEILFVGLTKEEAEKKEIELIEYYKSNDPKYGYNIEKGGNAQGKMSDETKRKISNALKGRKLSKVRFHTEEEKEKISKKLKGRPSPMKDRHWTEEQRKNVGTSIICLNTGEVFYSIREASRKTGADHAAIMMVLKGKYKKTKGLIFKYA